MPVWLMVTFYIVQAEARVRINFWPLLVEVKSKKWHTNYL